MVQQYITNASILLLCVFGHYLASMVRADRPMRDGKLRQMLVGIFFGLAGMFLVWAAILVEGPVRMDLRSIAVLIATMLGGWSSSLIAALFISVARFWQGGFYYASIVGVVSTFVIALGNILILRRGPPLRPSTWALGYFFTYVSIFLTYASVLRDAATLLNVMFYYTLVSLPTVCLCYILHMQLMRMNTLYDEVHYNEEKYRLLFQSAHDMAFLFSVKDGKPERYLEVNEAVIRFMGITREKVLAGSPADIYDSDFLAFEDDTEYQCALRGEQHIFEWSLAAGDGRFIPVEISGRVFRLRGELVCFAVARDISLRKESESRLIEANRMLEKLSTSDGLTGINNRRGMDLYYRMFWEQSVQYSQSIAIALIDIDCFKIYNDTYGHIAGDQCLKRIAGVLEQHAAHENGIAARFGGEEFILVLPDSGMERAFQAAVSIRKTVEEEAIPNVRSMVMGVVTLSIGVATCYPAEAGIEREELLKKADAALYMAKQSGRNRVMAWDQGAAPAIRQEGETGVNS
ncbi:MAG: cph2 5 [Paenibacillaceae bacterium]|jgi:diguanylate cyclase (GGDEF)-like protein/PAS domain S-box-containing protein|nr:cph2 5 [Paenibacillaceae bacterium]